MDNERMKNELMCVNSKINEILMEREGWEMEKKGMEDMCANLMVEVERLRTHVGDSTGGGLKLESNHEPSASITTSNDGARRMNSSTRNTHTHTHHASTPLPAKKSGPIMACPICPNPDPDCPCQQPAQRLQEQEQIRITETPLSDALPLSVPHQSDCGFCKTPAECLCRIVNETSTPPKPILPLVSKGKCDVCSSLTVCLCEDDTPPPSLPTTLPRASAAVPLSLRSRNRLSRDAGNGAGEGGIKKPLWRLDNVVKKGEAVCTGDPENCDACKNDSFGMSPFLPTFHFLNPPLALQVPHFSSRG